MSPQFYSRFGSSTATRRRIVAVIGSGSAADPCCAELGGLIASLGVDLLTGGGGGVMEAVSRAFFETRPRRGLVIGVVPGEVTPVDAVDARRNEPVRYDPKRGYPNPWVEIAIYTHLPDSGPDGTRVTSRNHINVLSADAIVALPGEAGTESEIWLATRYGVPAIAYGNHREGAPLHGIALARSIDEVRSFLLLHLVRESLDASGEAAE